jgi:putative acetyltransferase
VELKSMLVRQERRGAQLGRKLLQALLAQAERDGAQSVWLETGSDESIAAARRLYEAAGFEY